jgi:siroheme synthase-like protein
MIKWNFAMRFYPIFLDLKGRQVLVVGGGNIAQDKVEKLLAAGALVQIVSPELNDYLEDLVKQGVIGYRCGEFAGSDLKGKFLVVSATDNKLANETVARLACERGLLCNVVDQPALCNFITPALVTRGHLQIAISTGGDSPSVTQRVKREIAELIGDEYAEFLEIAADLRAEGQRRFTDYSRRRELMRKFVESEALDLIRAGRIEEAKQLAQLILTEVDSL